MKTILLFILVLFTGCFGMQKKSGKLATSQNNGASFVYSPSALRRVQSESALNSSPDNEPWATNAYSEYLKNKNKKNEIKKQLNKRNPLQ